ncbi:hypothetical protein [Arthrobacter globiformis]|uniref:hypothetical protein n=1 Tax=Arthrobacter globiformis TaxID=1665 RepID=UPI00278F9401|nr:hypothetical protein [Arthrobacter globiformis]MDQ0617418.1 hypothetical protein [Arthrobacter globiformis]
MSDGAPDSGSEPRAVPPRKPPTPPRIGTPKESSTASNGPPARPTMAVASWEEAPALDNYGEFIARLDAAAGKLTPRRDALATALSAAELLVTQNQTGLELWRQRLSLISQLLARHSGTHEARRYSTLRELHDVAAKMERMFTSRTQRVQGVCRAIRARRDQIDTSLFELEKSRVKLTSSRMLALERDNLRKVADDLAVSPEGTSLGFPDPGLRESLREAREAIILAEALLEVKGN